MYNTNQEFLSCFLFMINPFNRDLPHNATMGRDEILQQTPLKTPLDRIQYARQSFTPHYDHSMNKLIFIG
ncbi:hypothetical protein MMM150_06470 [Helicobacter pylori]